MITQMAIRLSPDNFYKIHHCEMFYTTWYAKKYILTQKELTNQTILRKSGDKSMTKVITRRRALQLARLKKGFKTINKISFC